MKPKHSSLVYLSLMLKNVSTGSRTGGTLGDLMIIPL